jgi:hypothetical protein
MPFTLAHPAIILPLKFLPKKWISMTGLVVGSVMPDFEAFIRTYSEKELTHSWPGFLFLGIPIGISLTFLFHNVVRDPFIQHLPGFLQQRFSRFTNVKWNQRFVKHWPAVILSLVIGGISHFFWDSFSHFDGWFINLHPGLQGEVNIFQREIEIPFLIQYINTLLGLSIILAFILMSPRTKHDIPRSNRLKFWVPVIAIATVLATPRFYYLPVNSADDLIIGIISTFLFALVIVTFFFRRSDDNITGSKSEINE